jgi:putative SOS response-associated peptidase YedK
MCGRLSLYTPPEHLARLLEAEIAAESLEGFRPSWNLPPTMDIYGARISSGGERQLERYRWGLVPPWAKDPSFGGKTINARAETIATKPSFKAAFRRRRLLIPADSYYEWKVGASKVRHPYLFRRTDGSPLVLAGLWEIWKRRASDPWLATAAVVTTSAGPDVIGIHNRMPVVLEPSQWDAWLDPELDDVDQLEAMLRPAEEGTLCSYPVDPRVNSPRNDDPACIEPFASPDTPLFV